MAVRAASILHIESERMRAYRAILRGHRSMVVRCLVLIGLGGLAEAVGIAALFPLLNSSLGTSGSSEMFGLEGRSLALAALGVTLTMLATASAFGYAGRLTQQKLMVTVEAELRRRLLAAFTGMRWTAYQKLRIGDASHAVLGESGAVAAGAVASVNGTGLVVVAILFVLAAAIISIRLTVLTLLMGVLGLALYRRSGSHGWHATRALDSANARLSDLADSLFQNFKLFRSTGRSSWMTAELDQALDEVARARRAQMRVTPQSQVRFELLGIAFIGLVLGVIVLSSGDLSQALVFLAVFYRLVPRIQSAQNELIAARSGEGTLDRWAAHLREAQAAASTPPGAALVTRPVRIDVHDLEVAYPGRDLAAVSGLTFTVAPGECVALVGESGGGKTTTLDVLSGLIEPTSGRISVNGTPLAELDLESWQQQLGLVAQDAPVFHASVLENVSWFASDPDMDKVWQAVRDANLEDTVTALPDGMATILGQRGSSLSGGQRQRLALARALYAQPAVLLLDEATSALDGAAEATVQQALAALKGRVSMVLVAHRLKTAELADRLIVISGGKVVEQGRWDELLKREGGRFRAMALLQGIEQS